MVSRRGEFPAWIRDFQLLSVREFLESTKSFDALPESFEKLNDVDEPPVGEPLPDLCEDFEDELERVHVLDLSFPTCDQRRDTNTDFFAIYWL